MTFKVLVLIKLLNNRLQPYKLHKPILCQLSLRNQLTIWPSQCVPSYQLLSVSIGLTQLVTIEN